nr:hypothetical protein [Photobacterium phosphoreum]
MALTALGFIGFRRRK